MHLDALSFISFVKNIFPEYFIHKTVLDVGAGDINGNNRFLFENCEYNGNDVIESKNTTIVSMTKDLPFENNYFDTIISTECFEHDPTYEQSFKKIYDMLKPGGLFFFTCAGIGRPEHGTRRTSPNDSFGTIGKIQEMQDYYKNLSIYDLNFCLNLNNNFKVWDSYYNSASKDLYFVGIKNDDKNYKYELKKYVKNNVYLTTYKIKNLLQ